MSVRGMNERIQRLREESLNTQAHVDMERARYFTETYQEYEGEVSIPELRALALKNYFAKKTLYIGDGELIVGEKGNSPQATPTFPDLCCHTVEDIHVMNDRKLINFSVKDEDYDYQEKVLIPYWEKRSIRHNIARGKDYNAGGARYNTSYIQGVGIGTITDSLAAIKYNVYDHEKFSMKELMDAMQADFVGYEKIKNLVTNRTPKYGNDDEYADAIMKQVFTFYRDSVTGRKNTRGGSYRINMLPTTCHVYFGDVMMASPNGRLAHKPVSEGISPEKGADVNGPTAVIKSCAKMDHLSTDGTLLNQKFTPSVVAGEQGLDQMANLIRTYFNMDGHHIQFNVIDRQTLIKAQQNPDEYRDLIVRVAGYSDHFRNLSKALQDEIIERTEQSFS